MQTKLPIDSVFSENTAPLFGDNSAAVLSPRLASNNHRLSLTNAQLTSGNHCLSDINTELLSTNRSLLDTNTQLVSYISRLSDINHQLTCDNRFLTDANAQLQSDNHCLSDANTQLTSENRRLSDANSQLASDNHHLSDANAQLASDNRRISDANAQLASDNRRLSDAKVKLYHRVFCVNSLCSTAALKKLFLYYTGFSLITFNIIFNFLVPDPTTLPFRSNNSRNICTDLCLQDQLFLALCKLRNNFHFKDLAYRFGISSQDASVIFARWINYMFAKFARVPIWPHRHILSLNMPANYKKYFPTTFVIIDGTEIRMQRPSALKRQSQCYSAYKSHTTMKALVGVDPRGAVIFMSSLFSGSISDKSLTSRSGFLEMLKDYVQAGYLQVGDGIMADKGFTIREEVEAVGLKLNIPPFAPSNGGQMPAADVVRTRSIATHRVVVERAIGRIKCFKIIAGTVDIAFMTNINQIWSVCCFLTTFQGSLIKK